MNAKQALKKASAKIQNMSYTLFCNKEDIKEYNKCILDQIDGKSPCPYCHDYQECQLEAKDNKGCPEWMLKMPMFTMADVKQEEEDEGEGLHVVGSES